MPEEAARERSGRSFGPVVLLGLGSSALAAVASAKPWYGSSAAGSGDASLNALDQGTKYPLASAASLVLLAAWGVLLVTRGVVRRVFAVLCLLAAVALVATVVAGHATLPDTARDAVGAALGRGAHPGFTGWFWTAAVASVVAVVAGVLAVRLVRVVAGDGQAVRRPGRCGACPAARLRAGQRARHLARPGRGPGPDPGSLKQRSPGPLHSCPTSRLNAPLNARGASCPTTTATPLLPGLP